MQFCILLRDIQVYSLIILWTDKIRVVGFEFGKFLYLYNLHFPVIKFTVITRREELLSMLIILKQDNKEIAELLAIAPRSVLMLRHRFRQKIGMDADKSLENFIEEILAAKITDAD